MNAGGLLDDTQSIPKCEKRWSLSDSNSWPYELWMSMMFCRYTASCHIISHPTSFSFAMLGWPRLLLTARLRKKEIYSLLDSLSYKISSIVFHLLSSSFIWDKFQILPCFTRTYQSRTVVTRHQTPPCPCAILQHDPELLRMEICLSNWAFSLDQDKPHMKLWNSASMKRHEAKLKDQLFKRQ